MEIKTTYEYVSEYYPTAIAEIEHERIKSKSASRNVPLAECNWSFYWWLETKPPTLPFTCPSVNDRLQYVVHCVVVNIIARAGGGRWCSKDLSVIPETIIGYYREKFEREWRSNQSSPP